MTNAIFGFLVAFAFVCIIMPFAIKLLRRFKFGQNILHYVEAHNGKQGTPTMGGLVFVIAICAAYPIFKGDNSSLAWMAIATFIAFALLGFLDDFLKIKHKDNLGLRAYQKALGQVLIAVIFAIFAYKNAFIGGTLYIPIWFGTINISWWIIPLVIFVFLATTNAVNLTDGLDGLASSVSIMFLIGIFIVLRIEINTVMNDGGALNYINELKNLSTLTAVSAGGLLAFFAFNANKASIFMGDVGSLAIGALISSICIFSRLTLYIMVFGVMFIVSVVSVIIQVLYFKKTKKRIFLMAPLHHHFEKKGVNENKIVVIYFVITAVVTILAIGVQLLL